MGGGYKIWYVLKEIKGKENSRDKSTVLIIPVDSFKYYDDYKYTLIIDSLSYE